MVQKRSRTVVNASTAPYRKNNPNTDSRKTGSISKERVEINKINNLNEDIPLNIEVDGIEENQCSLGHFVDVATFLPELALKENNQTNSLNLQGASKPSGTKGKPGIPSLPDTSPNINDGTVAVVPRIVLYKKPRLLWAPIPNVSKYNLITKCRNWFLNWILARY